MTEESKKRRLYETEVHFYAELQPRTRVSLSALEIYFKDEGQLRRIPVEEAGVFLMTSCWAYAERKYDVMIHQLDWVGGVLMTEPASIQDFNQKSWARVFEDADRWVVEVENRGEYSTAFRLVMRGEAVGEVV